MINISTCLSSKCNLGKNNIFDLSSDEEELDVQNDRYLKIVRIRPVRTGPEKFLNGIPLISKIRVKVPTLRKISGPVRTGRIRTIF